MTQLKLVHPVPWTDLLAPEYTRKRGDRNYDFAYEAPDAEGMPGHASGKRLHGGTDMFGPGNSPVRAPLSGKIVVARHSTDISGQVFGGVAAVESPDGPAVLFRHVQPALPLGAQVQAGEKMATISPWTDGWPHAHVEIYSHWPAAYDFRNTLNPRSVLWVEEPEQSMAARYYFEELPHTEGGIGPAIVWHGRGSPSRAVALHKARGRIVSTVRDADGISYVLWWLPGTYEGGLPVFGPWALETDRTRSSTRRQRNTGRVMRVFEGRHRSYYPTPA